MIRMIRVVGLLCMVGLSLCAQEPTPKNKIAKPMDPLAWLVGGVWTTDASKLGPEMVRIETRYTWSDNMAFIRFTTHFVMKASTLKNYDGQFFWSPASHSLRMWYMDARNELTEGSIAVDGDTFRFDFSGTNFEDKPAELRVLLLRKGNDLYTWQLQEKASEGWKEMAKLDYARSAN
jgi:hypothetical protein